MNIASERLAAPGLAPEVAAMLVCPSCRTDLVWDGADFICTGRECAVHYRLSDGIPVLADEDHSPVSFEPARKTGMAAIKQFVLRWLPKLDLNVVPARTKSRLADEILVRSERPIVLNIGGKHPTSITAGICGRENVMAIECDLAKRPRTGIFANPARIPLADGSVDAVMMDGLLEHVSDPQAVVAEAWRVLKPNGIVYSDAPFMLQVHGGVFDYARFSHQAQRFLFRNFAEIDSGISSGPGVALAYSIQYFLLSFTSGRTSRNVIRVLSQVTLFWLKYFDLYLAKRPASYDAAHGFYFLGRKIETALSEREINGKYAGRSPHLYRPVDLA